MLSEHERKLVPMIVGDPQRRKSCTLLCTLTHYLVYTSEYRVHTSGQHLAVRHRRRRRRLRCRPRPRRRAMPACFRLLSLPGGVVVQIMDCRTNVVPSWVLRTSVVLQSSMNASAANMYVDVVPL